MLGRIRKVASNAFGWRTNRKIVVIESDDWGSIRTRDEAALNVLKGKGFETESSNFVKYDSFERESDLSALYEVLKTVKDKNNRPAVFTPMTIVANPDFRKIEDNDFQEFFVEPFTHTGKRYEGSSEILKLYQQGIAEKLFMPEYHGREHLNHLRWLRGLMAGEKGFLEPFKVESFGFSHCNGEPIPDHLAAYDPEFQKDIPQLENSLVDGLTLFEDIFSYKANYFVASKSPEPKQFEKVLAENGVKYLTRYKLQKYPLGDGKFERELNWLGKTNQYGQIVITRNAGFEPSDNPNVDWVGLCMSDIKLAFKWKKPAVISSHRVNYMGRLSEQNRSNGIRQLKSLLHQIVKRWPDVEFMSSSELGDFIRKSKYL